MQAEQISLYYRDGGSDKVYHAQLEQKDEGWVVNFQYGRRGAALQSGSKTAKPLAFAKAKVAYDKIVNEKLGKGYSPGADGALFQGNSLEGRFTGIVPQLLNAIEESEVARYLADERWIAQEKFDGHRRLVRATAEEAVGINRRGLAVPLIQEIADDLARLGLELPLTLDGEQVGNVFAMFDILEAGGQDLRETPLEQRLALLGAVRERIGAAPRPAGGIYAVRSAQSRDEKQALFDSLRERNGEGIVFKERGSRYVPGRPASSGHHLKYKFVADGTFKVAALNPTRRSVGLAVLDEAGTWRPIGNVTIPSNQEIPALEDLVDVSYLYAFPGGSLFQPQYKGKRDDLAPAAASMAQLKYKPAGGEENEGGDEGGNEGGNENPAGDEREGRA